MNLPANDPDMQDATKFVRFALCRHVENPDGTATVDTEDVKAKLPQLK